MGPPRKNCKVSDRIRGISQGKWACVLVEVGDYEDCKSRRHTDRTDVWNDRKPRADAVLGIITTDMEWKAAQKGNLIR
jgi:hypothetical protein